MDFPMDFRLFCIYFITVSLRIVQIFTLLNVALSKISSILETDCVLFEAPPLSPLPPPPLAVFTTGRQAESRISLEQRCSFLYKYNEHCNTYILALVYNIFLKLFLTLGPMDLNIYSLERNPRL